MALTTQSQQSINPEQPSDAPQTPSSHRANLFAEPHVTPVHSLNLSKCRSKLNHPKRDLEWRERELQVNPDDSYQRRAAKIYTHGYEVGPLLECTRCRNSIGPFPKCVVAYDEQGYIARGCCANCVWYHRTDVCTLRNPLPCAALANAKLPMGPWGQACANYCFGEHLTTKQKLKIYHPETYKEDLRRAAERRAAKRKERADEDAEQDDKSILKREDSPSPCVKFAVDGTPRRAFVTVNSKKRIIS